MNTDNAIEDLHQHQKGIDDIAQHFLAKFGVFAARGPRESDMKTGRDYW